MGQKVIEGTWEEVSRRGRELAGRRVRVTVLDESAEAAAALDEALAPFLKEAKLLGGQEQASPAVVPSSERGDGWAAEVEHKYRRQGFSL
jgi:hypothetical protein